MTTVICSEPVTIDLELSGAALQVQTDSLVYTVEWRRWWQVWRPRCQSPGLPALHLHLRRRGEVPARSGLFLGLGERQRDDDGAGGLGGGPVMSESTMRYDPENDIFFHKHEDGSWSAYFCERHESLEEDEVRPYRGSFEPIGMAHPMTSHIEPLAAEARSVRNRVHGVKHDSRMLSDPLSPSSNRAHDGGVCGSHKVEEGSGR